MRSWSTIFVDQIIYELAKFSRLLGRGKFSITVIQIPNHSINELVWWYKSLKKYGNDVKTFMSVFADYLPNDNAAANPNTSNNLPI